MKNKLVSIAMATYNGEKYLKEQLDSIYAQTYKNIEVIVCDDCSSDKTVEILDEYKEKYGLKYYINEKNLGFKKNFEKAISLCSGDFIALADQDDIWIESKIEIFLKSKGIDNLIYMSDYLHKNFIDIETNLKLKENIVAYNPKKGIKFSTKLIQVASDIKFVPIENMTREEVIQLLQKAKVYIDFGFHPGKDRIPREAAILKCCIITNKKGSANFFEDLPIKNEYKFDDKASSIHEIEKKIQECFFKYDETINNFTEYVDKIKNQEKQFDNEIKEFIRL